MSTCEHIWRQVHEESIVGGSYPIGWKCEKCAQRVGVNELTPAGLGGSISDCVDLVGIHGIGAVKQTYNKATKELIKHVTALIVVLCAAGVVRATPVYWSGNGHAYQVWGTQNSGTWYGKSPKLNWSNAALAAAALTPPEGYAQGYLATFETPAEFAFATEFYIPQISTTPYVGNTDTLLYPIIVQAFDLSFALWTTGEGIGLHSYMVEWSPLPVPGDVNSDAVVNVYDINLISSCWGTSGPLGDANADNAVNVFDINMVSANWTPTATVVPEPTTIAMAAAALLMLLGRTIVPPSSQPTSGNSPA